MKELVVISGKGGTGKTSIVAAFAALANNAVLADCDVDAADLHLVLNPTVKQTTDFSGGKQASVIAEKCIGCRKCQDLCRFDAIKLDGPANDLIAKTYRVDPISCEGCKVCVEFCPADAIEFNDQINGQWFMSETRFGTMVHAELGIAEENSGKLVFLIRKETKRIAEEQEKDLIIIDGSPGIGCPVIASITGADLVLIVTEPTLSGKHDLERVAELAAGFGMPVLVAINKYDLNPEMAAQIEKDAGKRGIKVVGEIRYDKAVTKAQIAKQSIVEYTDTGVSEDIKTLWANVVETLN
ncbi:MAG: (4Fe-4S)-binding protein [Planctomycetota bacterium]|nr:MAG: (4Fe-4S)-binding protein [Planctomycetota bacterium]